MPNPDALDWLQGNALALYGAIVGTVALMLNLVRFQYDRGKDRLRLKVESRPDHNIKANAYKLAQPASPLGDGPFLLPGFLVTVVNVGHLPANVTDVGVRSKDGTDHQALVQIHNSMMLRQVSEARVEPIPPQSSAVFTVYLRREGPEIVSVTECYALDATGKRWSGKHRGV